jgi:hypothetical protein
MGLLRLTMKWENRRLRAMRLTILLCLLASSVFPSLSQAQAVPVFEITPVQSSIKFDVEASVAIKGIFDKWDATLS